MCTAALFFAVQLMIAATGRRARYTSAEAVRAILQDDRDSYLEYSQTLEAENIHISEPSDHSETEIVESARNKNQAPLSKPHPVRGRGRSRARGPAKGICIRRGRGQQLPEEN